jgi:hypothetical protein
MAVYISNQSGLWSSATTWVTADNGTLSPTGSASQAPQSGGDDKIIIARNHIVTYDVIGEFGDGSSTYTFSTMSSGSAIILSGGELKCSRTTNTELSAKGTIVVAPSGYLNWGTESDPVTAVTSKITLNSYPSLSVGGFSIVGRTGIYLFNSNNISVPTYNKISICGKEKTRNTYLTLSALSGSTLISVNNATNWEIGDRLIIEAEAVSAIATGTLTATFITGISGNDISINPGLNENKSVSRRVSNFSSNILVTSKFKDAPSYGFHLPLNAKSEFNVQNCSFEDIGANTWLALSASTVLVNGMNGPFNIALANYDNTSINIKNISYYQGYIGSNTNTALFNVIGAYPEVTKIDKVALYGANHIAFSLNTLCNVDITDTTVFRTTNCLSLAAGFPNKINVNNSHFVATNTIFGATTNGLNCNVSNSILRSNTPTVYLDGIQNLNISNCLLEYRNGIVRPARNSAGVLTYKNCSILQPSGIVGRDPTSTYLTNKTNYDCEINVVSLTGNPFDNRRFNYYYYSQSDLTKRKNSLNSWRFKPENANTLFKSIDEIPALAGVPQKIKGNIQFDSTYSTETPPYISFVGAGVNQTFTCGPTANIWQTFELDLNPTESSDITVTLFGQSSSTSGYVWLDGLNIDPYIKNARWYGYEFDSNIYSTANTLNTLTENQVSGLSFISNLDYLYDSSLYWTVNNPELSSYVDLVTVIGTTLDFGSRNIILNNTGTTFSYNSATNTVIINSPILSSGTNFNAIKTTGTVTLSTGVIQNLDINANIVQNTPTNLTGVYMLSASNTLTYNTNTPIEVEYTNCTMVGVKNDGTAIVTIKRINSSVTESDAEITTYAPTLVNLNLQGGYISIYDNVSSRQYYTNTDGTILLGSTATGTWTYKVARYGYDYLTGSFNVDPNVGGTINITPNYVIDPFVIAPLSSVQNYTDLNSSQKIHDYMSFFMTTSTGIEYGDLVDHSFGVLEFNYDLTLNATATSLVTFSGGIITVKSSSLNENITFLINGDFNQLNGNTISDGIKIRSNNLDSEFLFRNINSITFYPTANDRDNNTNAGLTTTATIYRFKYGVLYSNYVYNRITSDGIVFLKTTAIASGENIIDLGTSASIQAILGNQKIMNTGIQKASILVPHTTNI